MSNYNNNRKSAFNSASYPSKNINKYKKSPIEDEEVQIIGTRPAISRSLSPTVRNIEIPQTHRSSERKPNHNWKSRGQYDSSYYQPQPSTYNQLQQHHHDIITK